MTPHRVCVCAFFSHQVTFELKHRRGQLDGPAQAPKHQGYAKVAHAETAVPADEMDRA